MSARPAILRGRAFALPLAIARSLRSLVRDLTPKGRARRARERAFDAEHGIDTRGIVQLESLGLRGEETESFVRYQPIPPGSFASAIDSLPIRDRSGFSFVDIGAGKGRAMVLALEFGFDRVVGVEYSEALCETARRNLAIASAALDAAPPWDLHCGDATRFALPDGPCVVFMYNPFVGEVAEQFFRQLDRELERQPRALYVLYQNPLERERIARSPHFRELPIDSPDLAVFASREAQG